MRKSFKLLHVVPTYLPATRYGGTIHATHGLCRSLARAGHSVTVCTTSVDGDRDSAVPLGEAVDLDGVLVRYHESRHLRRIYWSPAMGSYLASSLNGFDIVHLHSVYLWPTWAAARQARRQGVPYVLSPRGMLVEELIERKSALPKRMWLRLIERGNIDGAAFLHATTELERQEIVKVAGSTPRIAVVPNGVEVPALEDISAARQRASADSPYFVVLGRLNWKKGIDVAIEAMHHVGNAELRIAGQDENGYRSRMEHLAVEAGVADRVRFLGPVYDSAKLELLAGAVALLLPSVSENFGNVVVEALAAGRPVIVSPGVGLASLARSCSCVRVVERVPEKLGAAMCELLLHPDRADGMGRRGRELVEQQFAWPAIADRMTQVYEEAITRGGNAAQAA